MQKRADLRKYHLVYKMTNLITGRWYIGIHSTDDLDDGYVGSGTMLWHSIKKHGKENHQYEILEFQPSRVALVAREKELVTWDEVNSPKCMNLIPGGSSEGCILGALNGLSKAGKAGGKSTQQKRRENPERYYAISKASSVTLRKLHADGKLKHNTFAGKKHTEESKAKMKKTRSERGSQKGERNSQYGVKRIGIHKDGVVKKVLKEEIDQYLSDGWILGFTDKIIDENAERGKYKRKQKEKKLCEFCNQDFIPLKPDRRFCSPKCFGSFRANKN